DDLLDNENMPLRSWIKRNGPLTKLQIEDLKDLMPILSKIPKTERPISMRRNMRRFGETPRPGGMRGGATATLIETEGRAITEKEFAELTWKDVLHMIAEQAEHIRP